MAKLGADQRWKICRNCSPAAYQRDQSGQSRDHCHQRRARPNRLLRRCWLRLTGGCNDDVIYSSRWQQAGEQRGIMDCLGRTLQRRHCAARRKIAATRAMATATTILPGICQCMNAWFIAIHSPIPSRSAGRNWVTCNRRRYCRAQFPVRFAWANNVTRWLSRRQWLADAARQSHNSRLGMREYDGCLERRLHPLGRRSSSRLRHAAARWWMPRL